jgi:ArsR family transcriptional regulator
MAALRRAKLVDSYSSGALRCYYLLRPAFVRSLLRLISGAHPVRYRKRDHVVKEAQQALGRKKETANV